MIPFMVGEGPVPWAERQAGWGSMGEAGVASREVSLRALTDTHGHSGGGGDRGEHRTHRWVSSGRGRSTIRMRRRVPPYQRPGR